MSGTCRCGGDAFVSYGSRTMRVLDHDGRYASREVERRRLRCRSCGTTSSHGGRDLAEGFRMTPSAYSAIAAACMARPFAEVAAEAGLDERTVRDVFSDWSGRILSPERPAVPAVAVMRSCDGPAGPWPQVVDGLTGDVCAAFPGLDDPRFARYLTRFRASDLHLDLPCLGLARTHVAPGNMVSLHALAARGRVEALLPRCLARLRAGLDHATRVALRGFGRAMLTPRFELDRAEAARIEGLFGRHPVLRRFRAACDEVRAVWLVPDPAQARGRLLRWAAGLDAMLKAAFRPVVAFAESFGDAVFTPSHGRIPRAAWLSAGLPSLPAVPGRTGPVRTACRIMMHAAATAGAPGIIPEAWAGPSLAR